MNTVTKVSFDRQLHKQVFLIKTFIMAYNDPNRKIITNRISRINWGGIFAGGLTALAVALLLNLLGVGVGFSTIDPLEEANPMAGLGTGAAIWWVLSNLIALFAGGYVAGRTAGFTEKTDGALHGFLAWGFYATVSFFLLTSSVSSVVNGVGGTIASMFSSNNNQQRVIVEVDRAQQQSQKNTDMTINRIKRQAFQLINQAERYNILPGDASEEVRSSINNAQRAVKDMEIDQDLGELVNDISYEINDGNLQVYLEGEKLDRAAIKDYLADNTELTEPEIERTVNKWQADIDQAVNQAQQAYTTARQKAVEYSDQAADALATACIGAFFALLLGALAAYFGGMLGSPKTIVEAVDPAITREKNYVTS